MIPPTRSNSDAWTHIELAGIRSPGRVVLSNHDRKIGWDIKEASGEDGATTTRKGNPCRSFTATFTLIRNADGSIDQFEEWDSFQALIESTVDGAKPHALDVYHPSLALLRFRAVTMSSLGGMTIDESGVGTIAVEFIEYNPPKPKPPASTSGSSSKKSDDAFKDAVANKENERKAAQEENSKTPWGSGLPSWMQ